MRPEIGDTSSASGASALHDPVDVVRLGCGPVLRNRVVHTLIVPDLGL